MRNKRFLLLVLLVLVWGSMSGLALVVGQDVVMMHDKGGNPNWQPFYEQQGNNAKDAVGVGFKPTPYPTTDVYIAAVKASLPTKKAPDMFCWWSTYRMKEIIDQGLVAETTALWEKHKSEFPQGVRDAYTFNGKQYGFTYSVDYWGIWYNKKVFSQYNLKVPKTWAEFTKVCDTLKKNGVIPMAQSVQQRWPTFILFEEMVARQSPDLYVGLCEGKVKYSDPKVKKAFAVWADLIGKGYFTDASVDLFADAPRLFNDGTVAMVPCGTWYYAVLTGNGVPEDSIDVFVMPSVEASAGKLVILESLPILMGKNAPNLAAAMKIVDWWMGPEGNATFVKLMNAYPSNSKADTSFLPSPKVNLLKTILNEKYRVLNRYWEATPTPICEQAVDKFAEFILNPGSVDKVLSDLDKIATDYWSKAKK
jgi:multiple sugar transport system substrate-binding protein/raffinose/stachyose/melibiose transport system substrate-binding protein